MGNTHVNRRRSSDDGRLTTSVENPPSTLPPSPVTYSSSTAIPGGSGGHLHALSETPVLLADYSALAAQPKLVPTVIIWSHDGDEVEVEGSFDNWTSRQTLQRSGRDHTIIKLLPPGVYQYKYIVDGQWRYDPNLPAMYDQDGNVNNVLEVQEYVPENLDGLSEFDSPPSPPESYNDPAPTAEDYAKDPPAMPLQLQMTLLNMPPAVESQGALLPRPAHAVLNHLYVQKSSEAISATVIGTTTRYKTKYITTVMYKPRKRPTTSTTSSRPIFIPTSSGPPTSQQREGPLHQSGPP